MSESKPLTAKLCLVAGAAADGLALGNFHCGVAERSSLAVLSEFVVEWRCSVALLLVFFPTASE